MRHYTTQYDIPEVVELSSSEHTAAKQYTCDHCRCAIAKGQRYRRTVRLVDGDLYTERAHIGRCTSRWWGWTPAQMTGEVRAWEARGEILKVDSDALKAGIREVCQPDLAGVLVGRIEAVPTRKRTREEWGAPTYYEPTPW